jgi:hypothetical protein
MNFASALSDAEFQLPSNGFSSTLWTPEFGWNSSEAEASQDAHSPQLLAALQIFLWFFIAETHRVWVHLAAEMQAGKTGVVSALLRLIFANAARIHITPDRIFVLTGMSDNAWIKQTRERLPSNVRVGVAHSGGFRKIVAALRTLARDGYLENVLIIFDESHIASLASNRPNRLIYDEVARLCPRDQWEARNIRFLTISATDPAKSSICAENRHLSKVVRLLTSDAYQSVESLHTAGRVRYNDAFGNLDDPRAMAELQRAVAQHPNPLFHILRPRQGKQDKVEDLLKIAFPGCVVIPWDSSTQIIENSGDSSTSLIEDINELLAVAPEVHTFILLKNMFYASKTMDDTHVGILWDRKGGKDDTNLQSLLGRALGYGKSTRTVVYTSKETVENYLGFWRDAIAGLPLPTDIPIERIDRLDKKMAGVQRVRMINGRPVVTVARNFNGPGGGTGVVPEVRAPQFERGYRIFDTQDENEAFARTCGARRRTSYDTDANGFSLCSNVTKRVHSTQELIHFAENCRDCSNMDRSASDVQLGEYACRRYVCYNDLTDNTTRKYMTIWFKRIAEA